MTTKVTISGTSSSGKTTLFRALEQRLPGADSLPEHTWVLKSRLPSIDWRSRPVRDYLLIQQLFSERSPNKTRALLCDTGVIDAVAHTKLFGGKLRLELLKQFQHTPYQVVFLTDPAGPTIEDNGIRETDPLLRLELHEAILQAAAELGQSPILLRGSTSERIISSIRQLQLSLGSTYGELTKLRRSSPEPRVVNGE